MAAGKIALLLFIVALATLPASGHHAAPFVDLTKVVTINGTISKIEWVNPHVWIYVDQNDPSAGKVQWGIQMESPRALQEQGLTRDMIKPGDAVTLSGTPAKPKSHSIFPFEFNTASGFRWAARVTYK